MGQRGQKGLYSDAFEHDSCGFGLMAQMDNEASHALVRSAIRSLCRLTHRGAIAADGKTGDGCGLLLTMPGKFLRRVTAAAGIELADRYAAGLVFLNPDHALASAARERLEAQLTAAGLQPAGWREVPVDREACGATALATLPRIEQVFVNAPAGMSAVDFERSLFIARRWTESKIRRSADPVFYVASLSSQTLSYKAMVMPAHLDSFYPDLKDPELAASVCLFHQRFSTNTLPQWRLAQPFRYLAHNGEINTIQGNRNWAQARGSVWQVPGIADLREMGSVVSMSGSDSASLDNMLEVMLAGDMDMLQALRLLIPPAWQTVDLVDPDVRAFYEFFAPHLEPWDGPAGIVSCDGRYAICVLDRNGLRPARYTVTRDRIITVASETGVYACPPEDIVAKGKLGPGEMLAVDLDSGELLYDDDIDEILKKRAPYKKWLKEGVRYLESMLYDRRLVAQPVDSDTLDQYQKMFGVSFEERIEVIRVLAETEREAVGSMGDDTPIAVISGQVRSIYDYFRQQFAQVTNPPIDPLRESIVMSLQTQIGRECNIFEPAPEHAWQIILNSPVLAQRKLVEILSSESLVTHEKIELNVDASMALADALDQLCNQAEQAARDGKCVLLLSDREIGPGRLPVHALLATGAIHHRLVQTGLRCNCNIIVETGTARDPHHFACLIGFGATAVYPYLAYQVLYDMTRTGEIKADYRKTQVGRSYRRGIRKGLLKIMSKMGISTIASYRGAQLFEIVGLADDVVGRCFPGTVSRLQGATFADLEADQRELARRAWSKSEKIEHGGQLKYVYGGEYHMYNAEVIGTLQAAARTGKAEDYAAFARAVNERPISTLRDLMEIDSGNEPVPLEEVEPVEAITARFDCAGMSLGALSPEAHEALATAMNRIGARSNSGEGGEDPARHGTGKMSKIKQVASGRFGVTPEYLVNAEVIQIKMAQGAKPGEGGQLPGHKVDETIARLRFARPGIGLISPPPHHDIYSIEDLAQLIFDLKEVNPGALVSVKLVAEPGVGTIAAGVAKCYADLITISGHDGGTGASPLTSVKYAGSPWEIGLAETHQTLRRHDLRGMVRVQTDGGLKTGLDVVKAALLGAESFGFGTAPLVALGCKYLRICHLNNCATGVATQNNVLRKKHFIGLPEMAINYFRLVAEDVRQIMASLGVRRLEELIGHTEWLRARPGETARQRHLDLSPILSDGGVDPGITHYCTEPSNDPFDRNELAERMVADCLPAIEGLSGGRFEYTVNNYHRSIGARVSGEIARRHGNYGMSAAPVELHLSGSAGQSLGAWNAGGLHIHLEGDANDYVGKGMAAGKIVLRPPSSAAFVARDTVIAGNTCLYGATGGELFAAGTVGERFGVRNSGAVAVVEGAGDHCCEYMTDGVIVVLGSTGLNFAAGMTGGFAYVLDEFRDFVDCCNQELVDITRITPESMEAHLHHLRALIGRHVEETGSVWAQEILDDFRAYLGRFWVVKPKATDIDSLIDSLRRAA